MKIRKPNKTRRKQAAALEPAETALWDGEVAASPSSALRALTSGALALGGMAGNAMADAPIDRYEAEYNFSYYTEDDIKNAKAVAGSERGRYEIEWHQLNFTMPVGERWDVGIELVNESMSGASPWFVVPDAAGDPIQTMTGASIEDNRTDLNVTANRYQDNGRIGYAFGYSTEDDYSSISLGLDGETHFNEKNTTLSGGLGLAFDQVDPVQQAGVARISSDDKKAVSLYGGLSQILSRQTVIKSSLTYKFNNGFLSDPYKQVCVVATGCGGALNLADNRPDSRHQLAWLSEFRHHILELNGTIHADYQYYFDTWDISSHTISLAWHQQFFNRFKVIPSLRYYSQSAADFYTPFFAVAPAVGTEASSDFRLAGYGAIAFGIGGEYAFQTRWTGDREWVAKLGWQTYFSSEDLSHDDSSLEIPGLVDYDLVTLGLSMRW